MVPAAIIDQTAANRLAEGWDGGVPAKTEQKRTTRGPEEKSSEVRREKTDIFRDNHLSSTHCLFSVAELAVIASPPRRLSGAFGLTISQLLDEALDHEVPRATDPDEARGVQRGVTADSWTDPETGYRRRPVSSADFPADVTEVRLPAGAQVAYPASAYAFLRHCIWVVDGVLEVVVGDEPTRLGAGDRIELGEPADVVYRNPGAEPVRYVVVVVRAPRGRE